MHLDEWLTALAVASAFIAGHPAHAVTHSNAPIIAPIAVDAHGMAGSMEEIPRTRPGESGFSDPVGR